MKKKRYTESEIKFMLDNYPLHGPHYCSEHLGRSYTSIMGIARRLNIKVAEVSRVKSALVLKKKAEARLLEYMSKQENYIENFTPDISYTLGFLWGDGFLTLSDNRIYTNIEMAEEDFNQVFPFFKSLENEYKWKIYKRHRKDSWKPSIQASISDRYLGYFLNFYDYKKKSGVSADKIVELIPTEYLPYFFRGYFDADCHFKYERDDKINFNISSVYDQDWGFVSKYLNDDRIKISNNINKKGHKRSDFNIYNRASIKNIYNKVYKSYTQDKIGLKRKCEKFVNCINLYYDDL